MSLWAWLISYGLTLRYHEFQSKKKARGPPPRDPLGHHSARSGPRLAPPRARHCVLGPQVSLTIPRWGHTESMGPHMCGPHPAGRPGVCRGARCFSAHRAKANARAAHGIHRRIYTRGQKSLGTSVRNIKTQTIFWPRGAALRLAAPGECPGWGTDLPQATRGSPQPGFRTQPTGPTPREGVVARGYPEGGGPRGFRLAYTTLRF